MRLRSAIYGGVTSNQGADAGAVDCSVGAEEEGGFAADEVARDEESDDSAYGGIQGAGFAGAEGKAFDCGLFMAQCLVGDKDGDAVCVRALEVATMESGASLSFVLASLECGKQVLIGLGQQWKRNAVHFIWSKTRVQSGSDLVGQ